MKTADKKHQSVSYTTTEEVALPAEPSPAMGIRARDWNNLRKLINKLVPGANRWELLFSSSLSVFLSFLFPSFSTQGDIEGWKLFFVILACFSGGVALVSLVGMLSSRSTFSSDKAMIVESMDDIESMYASENSDATETVLPPEGIEKDTVINPPYVQNEDDYYKQAVNIAMQRGKISSSMVQRHLRVGYARAARIVQRMEDEGIVGPMDGARPRDVIVDTKSE